MSDDWVCLTPETDAEGRRLTKRERLQHAKELLVRTDAERLDTFRRELEADPEISERDARRLAEATKFIQLGARAEKLTWIAKSLPDDDAPSGSIH